MAEQLTTEGTGDTKENKTAKNLTREEVKALLQQARQSFPHDECLTCEYFLGYLTQLGIGAGQEVHSLFDEMGVDYQHMHSCRGCDSCLPAHLFADYLRGRAGSG